MALVFVLLGLAGFANASIKRHRATSGSTESAAVSAAVTKGGAISTAWYCAGPLPLGLRSEHSLIAIGNVSRKTLSGALVVATETGVSRSVPLDIAPRTSRSVRLGRADGPAFGSVTVLLDGAGAGVEEIVVGPTGSDAAPCVSHASFTEYLAGGATKAPSSLDLAVFDPGATPSVVSVTIATPTGVVAPPAFQEVPVQAGETLVFNVTRNLPLQTLLGTTVSATGGRVVAGALSSAGVAGVSFPALVSASAVAAPTWYFAPGLSAPGDAQGYVVLNPGSSPARVTLTLDDQSGPAVLDAVVPGGGIVELSPASDKTPGALRGAMLTSSAPVVAALETLVGPFARSKTSSKRPTTPNKATSTAKGHRSAATTTTITPPASAPSSTEPITVPGFSTTAPSPVLDSSWLIEGGERDGQIGEYVAISNPASKPAVVRFSPLGALGPIAPVTVAPRSSAVVDLGQGADPAGSVAIEVVASEPVVVGSGLYARGSSGSIGISAPVAIPVD